MAVKNALACEFAIVASSDDYFYGNYPDGDKPTGTPGQAILTWTAAASPPANGYAVYWSTSATEFPGTQRSTVAAGVVTKTLTGLPAGTVYFRVTAIHGRRESWHLAGSAVIT